MGDQVTDMRKEIRFEPGYDHRDDPKDSRGAAGLGLWFIYGDETTVLTATVSTGWMLNPLKSGYARSGGPQLRRNKPGPDAGLWDAYPTGSNVTIHSIRQVKDWWQGPEECQWLGGVGCYGDTGYLVAEKFLAVLVAEGSEGAWKWMAETLENWMSP